MYTSDIIRSLCDYHNITRKDDGLHATLDRLDAAAGIDTTGHFKRPHAGAYTVGIRVRMHEDRRADLIAGKWRPLEVSPYFFWLGAEA